jgi:hypothetical protein
VTPELAAVEPGDTVQMEARVSDRWGNEIPDAELSWSSSDEDVATVSGGTVMAQASGSASIQAQTGSLGAAAMLNVVSAAPRTLVAASGGNQTGTAGMALAETIAVQVLDEAGTPVPGVTVSWSPRSGSGSVTPGTSTTDDGGMASTSWTLGQTAGAHRLDVEVSGIPGISVTATAVAGPLAFITVLPQEAEIGVGDNLALTAQGADEFGNAVALPQVTWSSTDTEILTVTSQGTATGIAAGSASVAATASSVTGQTAVSVVAEVQVPAAATATGGTGQSGAAGETLSQPLQLQVLDAQDQPIAGASVSWAVTVGGGTLSATTTATNASGVAEVTWTLGGAVGQQTVSATVASLSPVNFQAQVGPGEPAEVVLSPESASIQLGDSVQFSAEVADSFGNVITDPVISWSSDVPAVASVDGTGLAISQGEGSTLVRAAAGSAESTASLVVQGLPDPAGVTDLSVASVTDSTVTLEWTQVDDGTGQPANYALRYATPSISWGPAGDTEQVVPGIGIGMVSSFTWEGLNSSTSYEFQLVPYRDDPSSGRAFGPLSNTVEGVTSGTAIVDGGYVELTSTADAFQALGQTGQLTAVVRDALGNPVEGFEFQYSSSNPSVVEVNAVGQITARAVGTVMIVASTLCCDTSPTQSAPLALAVNQVPASVDLSAQSISLAVGESSTVTATVTDSLGNPVDGVTLDFASSDTNVVAVTSQTDQSVRVEGVGEGSASVDVTATIGGYTTSTEFSASVFSGQAPPPAEVWFEEDWDYANSSEMHSNPNGWLSFPYGTDHVSHGQDPAAPWPGDGDFVEGLYGPRGNNSGVVSIDFPDAGIDQPSEFWFEVYIWYSDNWRTDWPGSSNDDHKTVLWNEARADGGTRVSFKAGNFGTDLNLYFSGGRNQASQGNYRPLEANYWDGTWRRHRFHVRLPTPGNSDGVLEFWLGDDKLADARAVPHTGSYTNGTWIGNVRLGVNTNNDPTEDMSIRFGRTRMFLTDPGW